MWSFCLSLLTFGFTTLAARIETRMPSLIVPLSSYFPDTPQNTQKRAFVDHDVFTEISFDVPSNAAKSCKLGFYINVDPDRGAPWSLWGEPPYLFNVSNLQTPMNKDVDTWNNRPRARQWIATIEVQQNGKVNITGGDVICAKGWVAQFLLTPGSDREFGLNWFELTDPLHGITYEMFD